MQDTPQVEQKSQHDVQDDVQHESPQEAATLSRPFRAGFVALMGKPNVGKSTLLNAILEQKIAIVSRRPQTTRVPLRGILNRPDAQIIFVDTPGLHEPSNQLGQVMVKLAQQTSDSADVVCQMVDISNPPTELDQRIAKEIGRASTPRLLVLNKVDIRPRSRQTYLEAYRDLATWDMEVAISARTGAGVPQLINEITTHLPEGEALYPEDWIVDQSIQNIAAEFVREKVLRFTNQEVPHSVAVEVDEWEDRGKAIYVRMTINVEKPNQKGILIGAGGSKLKHIGQIARGDIERLTERSVYLDLWVKVRRNWRNDVSSLGWLGYNPSQHQ